MWMRIGRSTSAAPGRKKAGLRKYCERKPMAKDLPGKLGLLGFGRLCEDFGSRE
jgi:hypothetical protein